MSDGQLLFIVNSNLEKPLKGSIKIKGADVAEMNTLSGEINGYTSVREGENINLTIDLPPAGSLLLYIHDSKQETLPAPSPPKNTETLVHHLL